ncbi:MULTISPECIES: pyruvate carboxylase [Syntrophotalea]|jgi:pyruvate carboxylase|uniref:Pyruvate carboxylase n=1 Tax=Syntrophotalea acetylenica TaxID=29542 RepID=A0A1L3GJG4_SYNAC|nr:pyruvate carboxylase [Syntrophotalea acetylenica]APG26083.1 pyruvate carboxylase [Syntrophotalea acetylenica]APG44148.1 pyruvate carboxylase [Syntrophotalea acetylenica]MDY0261179.1 pyruvate carboxylase [Syntrophotalea acetylenica]
MEIKTFNKVMAANRGEIAIRIFRACIELGIKTVAIYSEEDRVALHRYKADESYRVGKGKGPIEAYLGIDEIIDLAKKKDVDAIHPGYGFLSENPEFAEACERAGIALIGPGAEIQRKLGDKVAARKVAIEAGVPVVPGTDKPVTSEEEALLFAAKCGYPIMVKAAAGGGGRGMRIARNRQELAEGLRSASSEAKAAFGNPSVFLEKYIENPKHVEVQILGDQHGSVVHFYDRDCSIQRRHQKVIEVAPSPNLSAAKRQELCDYALRIANHVGYVNAGTVEFLMDAEGHFYFIEVNTRIQVEHTVTEMVTGRNLVRAQIRVAEGYRLSDPEINIRGQKDIQLNGFAIQARVTTEDPTRNFSPDFGTITAYRSPGGFGVRLDAGSAFPGARISPHYDSLLVKISGWGLTLREAARTTDRSLAEFRLRGVKCNIGFLANVINHPTFLAGACDTSFIDTHPELFEIPEKRDRSSKLLSYIGHVVVNGYPGIKNPLHYKDLRDPRIPEIRYDVPRPKGSRDILLEKGAEGLARWALEQPQLLITDTTMRDAHQSLMATRFRTHDLAKIAPATSHLGSGLFSLEMWGGASFDVAMRFLREDPWERLDRLRRKIPNILFQMLLRASNAVGYCNYPDNVVREFVAKAAESGIDVFRIFDSLNWTKGMQVAMDAVRKSGGVCEAAICYTGDILDPKRDKYPLSYYVNMAKELEKMGAHILGIKDMAGLLKPLAAEKLVRALKQEVGIPIHLHTHDTSSNGGATLLLAAQAGVDIVDTALSSVSGLTAQPNMNALLAALKGHDRDPGLDEEGIQKLANYWETVRTYYAPFESELRSGTAQVYHHEIPGGQYSNYKPQVEGFGLGDRWEECKEMYRKVNDMFGDIIKVTPSSKIVGDMTMFMVQNNLQPEDVYERGQELTFPQGVVDFFKGMIGQPHGGFPEKLQKIVLKGEEPLTCRPGEFLEPVDFVAKRQELENKLGHPVSERDVLSAVLYPGVFEEFDAHRTEYQDTSVLPTPVFFYGLDLGDECTVEMEPGKNLLVQLNAIGRIQDDGHRDIYFELNGEPRQIMVPDLSVADDQIKHRKADPDNLHHVGAPMPGKVFRILVDVGCVVKKGDILLSTEAMKMETNVKAEKDGVVAEILIREGTQVEQGELLLILE